MEIKSLPYSLSALKGDLISTLAVGERRVAGCDPALLSCAREIKSKACMGELSRESRDPMRSERDDEGARSLVSKSNSCANLLRSYDSNSASSSRGESEDVEVVMPASPLLLIPLARGETGGSVLLC
jgi:hypothetical protein